MIPPDPATLNPKELMKLLFIGRRFQGMSSEDKYNQVQLMTMSAIDFLDQWFETDVLKATMSASGIIGTFLGVRSPGTAYVLLHHYMGEIDGAFRAGDSRAVARAPSRTRLLTPLARPESRFAPKLRLPGSWSKTDAPPELCSATATRFTLTLSPLASIRDSHLPR